VTRTRRLASDSALAIEAARLENRGAGPALSSGRFPEQERSMRWIARRPGLLVLGALALAPTPVLAQDKPPTRALRIATIDPVQVMRESKWAQRLAEQVKQEHDALSREQRDLEAQIQKAQVDLKTWNPGTREYDIARRDLVLLSERHQRNGDMYTLWMNRRQAELELTIHQALEREVQELAATWELDLVMRRRSETPRDQERSLEWRHKAMSDNQVVFAAKDLDITKTIIARLDNKQNAIGIPLDASGNGGAKGEPAPAKAPTGKEEPAGKDGPVKEAEKR
jgi:Skp family chaperone for outer membrane proteins